MKVSGRARRHEDRGGDPLDGLVNLFDLGIVLAVAFLLAALASLDLTSVLTDERAAARASEAADSVTVTDEETVRKLELEPGERVVGSGREIGRVYRLEDGRTVIVRPSSEDAPPGETGTVDPVPPEGTAAPGTAPPGAGFKGLGSESPAAP